jgi:hypothetical protein
LNRQTTPAEVDRPGCFFCVQARPPKSRNRRELPIKDELPPVDVPRFDHPSILNGSSPVSAICPQKPQGRSNQHDGGRLFFVPAK